MPPHNSNGTPQEPTKRKATSIDIAYEAGVSQSTVSRALSGSPLVSDETRQRIQAIAKALHYTVDKNASNLRSQSTKTIALLLADDPTTNDSHINPFFLSLLGGITHATAKRGFDLLVSFQQLSQNWLADYEEAHRADGLILLGYGDYVSAKDKLIKLKEAGAHFVLWGPNHKELPGHSIGCNNEHGSFLATEHLLNRGCNRLAFLGDISPSNPEFYARHLGFTQALKKYSIAHNITGNTTSTLNTGLQIDAQNTEEAGKHAVEQLLNNSNHSLQGLVCASDTIAFGAIKALHDKGLKIPDDICVTGFDDMASAAYITPSLTTVRQSTTQAGELLVEQLMQQIKGEPLDSVTLMPQLIIRESS